MKRLTVILLILVVSFAVIGCKTSLQAPTDQSSQTPQTQTGQNPSPAQESSTPNTETPPGTSGDQPAKESQVKIFLIALDDNGKSGKNIGTGDSLVAVERTISTPQTPLTAAFNELLAIKEPYYGNSGLYNALYRSNLKVDKAAITNGKAEIYLSGSLSLGGVMDNPRVENQLNETALQFSSVKEVQIYLNGKTLKDALSLK